LRSWQLVQAVKRNIRRFPADFMFQLTPDEARALRSQSVILKGGRGQHCKYPPYAFTEQGVAMLSGVLHSDRAAAEAEAAYRVRSRREGACHSRPSRGMFVCAPHEFSRLSLE
jgi:hypothetical protein